MVIKGRIRGGGRQLASYLLTQGENEDVQLLYVDGQQRFDQQDFRDLLGDFSLTEKLTRSRKGIYHATINPPQEFSRQMSKEDWLYSAQTLAAELGFSEQRMALVLHKKHGRQHLHVAIERTNLDTGRIMPISHNYSKHLKAGQKLSQHFGLQEVPERNPRRVPMKEALTRLWHDTPDAKTFIRQAKQQGYMVSKGYDRKPFLVVDNTGRSFNLVRHLDGIKTNAVRDRFKGTILMEEREAVAFVRSQLTITENKQSQNQKDDRQAFLDTIKQARNQQRTFKPRMH